MAKNNMNKDNFPFMRIHFQSIVFFSFSFVRVLQANCFGTEWMVKGGMYVSREGVSRQDPNVDKNWKTENYFFQIKYKSQLKVTWRGRKQTKSKVEDLNRSLKQATDLELTELQTTAMLQTNQGGPMTQHS